MKIVLLSLPFPPFFHWILLGDKKKRNEKEKEEERGIPLLENRKIATRTNRGGFTKRAMCDKLFPVLPP